MRRLRRRAGEEEGQSLVFFVVGMTAFVLMVALVVDVGMWFQAQRKTQSVVDAAALAGVQALPYSQARADADARTYAHLNSPDTTLDSISFPGGDSIEVRASVKLPAFFSGLAGIAGVTARARAAARIGPIAALGNDTLRSSGSAVITPLLVNERAVCLACSSVTLSYDPADSSGSDLGMMCPDGCLPGVQGRKQLAALIADGMPGSVTYGDRASGGTPYVEAARASATDGGQAWAALADRARSEDTLIVPVYDGASDGLYHIGGFAAFVITDANNGKDTVTGHFTTYQAPGALSPGGTAANYGVSVIGLTT